jgi:hypothetical protein
MIRFEIIKSPDFSVITNFCFLKNELHIGRENGDLLIADPELHAGHIMFEVHGSDLLIHPHREVEYYLINGKRATAIRKLKLNNEVTIGQTVFRILDFSETVHESKKEILNRKLNKLIEEDSGRLVVIEKLSSLMK